MAAWVALCATAGQSASPLASPSEDASAFDAQLWPEMAERAQSGSPPSATSKPAASGAVAPTKERVRR